MDGQDRVAGLERRISLGRVVRTTAVVSLIAVSTVLVGLLLGSSWASAARFATVVWVTSVPMAAAVTLWRGTMRPEAAAVSGSVAAQVALSVAGVFPGSASSRVLIVVLVGVFLALVVGARRGAQQRRVDIDWPSILIAGLVLGAWAAVTLAAHPVSSPGQSEAFQEIGRSDAPFFEVLSNGLNLAGLGESGIASDVGLRYHVLGYSWLGSMQEVTGRVPFGVQLQLLPGYFAALISLAAVAWSTSIIRSRWGSLLAAVLVLVAGTVATPALLGIGGSVVKLASPSTSIAALWTLVAVWVMTVAWKSRDALLMMVTGILSFAAFGAKTSGGFTVLCASLGLVAFALATSRGRRSALVIAASVLVGVLGSFLLLASGQASGGGLELMDWIGLAANLMSDPRAAGAAVITALAFAWGYLPRWSGVVGFARRPVAVEGVVAASVLVGSMGAFLALDASSVNRGWFPVSAAPILGVLAASGLVYVRQACRGVVRWAWLWGLGTAGAVAAILTADRVPSSSHVALIPLVASALCLVVALAAQDWRVSSVSRWARTVLVVKAVAVPMTVMAVLAGVLLTPPSTPGLPSAAADAAAAEWGDSIAVAQSLRETLPKDAVMAVASEHDLWAPSLTQVRSFLSGEEYFVSFAARGSSSQAESRRQELDRLFEADNLPVNQACDLGIDVLWASGPTPLSWGAADVSQGSVGAWLLDCGVEGT